MTANIQYFDNSTDQTAYADAAALSAVDTSRLPNGSQAVVTNLGFYQLNSFSKDAADATDYIAASAGGNWVRNYGIPTLLLNASNQIDGSQLGDIALATLSAGSATAPSLAFTGDTDTGMFSPAANTIGFTIGGVLKASLSATAFNVPTGVAYQVNATQVVGARQTGWVAFAGAATTNHAAINATTITATDGNIQALAQAVNGIQTALTTHGLIGA